MDETRSQLEAARAAYMPRLPQILERDPWVIGFADGEVTTAVRDAAAIAERFPETYGRPILQLTEGSGGRRDSPLVVGVVLSGGQAPGGHNVIAGLLDGVKATHLHSRLVGFSGGPRGILESRFEELTPQLVGPYRNTGGFDLIGSGRDKIETPDQLQASRAVCRELGLDGLVIVGGDDSNTNAAVLAEYFLEHDQATAVIGVPKTIDGDLKSDRIEASFGFDTATRVYSELIGNICRDARSARKYWHFVKLMGRSASHVTLECALQTRPNVTLIAEEVRAGAMTLDAVVDRIADVIRRRAAAGRRYGVCLIPEGLIEFIPEMRVLIDGLNLALAEGREGETAVVERLDEASRRVFNGLPDEIRRQLLIDRDSHGNVQVSKIDTEQLLIDKVRRRLDGKLSAMGHFFGYEGRCSAPSNFDADYTYSLGRLAALLAGAGKTGYMCGIGNLARRREAWTATAVPLTSLMQIEVRHGREVPVIGKALVDLEGAPFRSFARWREHWELEDAYLYPGPIQYFGPPAVSDSTTRTLQLERPRSG